MSVLDAPIARIDGTPSSLREIAEGSVALVVNVASQCGLTPQYTQLQALQEKYVDRGFTVVGVPCNQFGAQEPGTAEEIVTFCDRSYGVTFPLTEKVDVNGPERHPIFDELSQATTRSGKTGDVSWNFEKWLVDRDGTVLARFSPQVPPDDPRIIEAVESALG
ncbi:MAG TPA: glutathione peroxidase [Nocardioidaceae bacterium]|nr:glutathione peroxidase [Nocardioidaceae bacterium]